MAEAGRQQCLVTGEALPEEQMLRLVLSPEAVVTPDVAQKLPGAEVWVKADAAVLAKAEGLFAEAFGQAVTVPPEMAALVAKQLLARVQNWLSLASKAGDAVSGLTKVQAAVSSGNVHLLLHAVDAATDGKARIQSFAREAEAVERVVFLTKAELGAPFGREEVVHVAVTDAVFATRIYNEMRRLAGFREMNAL